MSIEQTRLVIGSAKRDGSGASVTPPPICVEIYPVDPSQVVAFPSPDGNGYQATFPALFGQIVAFADPALPNTAKLFIAATDGQWYPVELTSLFIDSNTGKPYDPNAVFYNPLAS